VASRRVLHNTAPPEAGSACNIADSKQYLTGSFPSGWRQLSSVQCLWAISAPV